jgi:general secretion pathway protein D
MIYLFVKYLKLQRNTRNQDLKGESMRNILIAFIILLLITSGYTYAGSDPAYFHSYNEGIGLLAMSRVPETGDEGNGPLDTGPTFVQPSQDQPPAKSLRDVEPPAVQPHPEDPEKPAYDNEQQAVSEVPGSPAPSVEEQRGKEATVPSGSAFTLQQTRAFLAQPAPQAQSENYIILNFDNAALKDVINTISSITGTNFIVAPGLDARITIHSTDKIPTTEALNVFESILELNNMTIVKSGRFFKIVPASTAKQRPIEIQKGKDAESVIPIDRIITQIVQVDFVPAAEISKVIQPMLSQFGGIIPDPRTNLLIINEIASNLKRLLVILEEIDVNAFENTRMMFFQPKYSDVGDLSEELMAILNGLNISQQGVAMIPIERINSMVVFTASPSLLETIEGWLKKLDEEISTGGQNVFVYAVQNVKAESIANVLKMIYERDAGIPVKIKTTAPKAPAPQKKGEKPSPAPFIPSVSTSPTAKIKVEIAVYEPTNSLVILASPGIYRDIKETIKKLDLYPQEVLIEAIIAEVTLTDADDFGVQWSILHTIDIEGQDIEALTQSRSGDAPPFSLPLTLGGADASASLLASGISLLAFKENSFTALVHALASRGKVNILSSPRLLVRDQEEASIEVGSDIPTATSTTSTTTTDTLTQNIEYRTIGIKLNIKPTINDERTVVLDLEQEVSSKGADQQVGQSGNLFPSFNTTKTKTSIIVPDKQGVVIGGIMEEEISKNYQGVPVFSSIPILGHIFRYTKDSTVKKELVIIITPHVVSNKTEAEFLTTDFLEKLQNVKGFLKKNNDQGTPLNNKPETLESNGQ